MLADADNMTVQQFLERWLTYKASDGLKPKTLAEYRRLVGKRIIPVLGRKKLEPLRPLDVEHLVKVVRDGQSASEAKRVLTVLSMALQQAVRWQKVPRNVAQAVKAPRVQKRDLDVWQPEEVVRFLAVARQHRLSVLFELALTLGLRSGELLGLRWQDVDFQQGWLSVEQNAVEIAGRVTLDTPKTAASRRRIKLDGTVLHALQQHQARQALDRELVGEVYQELGLSSRRRWEPRTTRATWHGCSTA